MKRLVIIAAVFCAACATQHRPPAQDLRNVYIDCTNRAAFEKYYADQLTLTDMRGIESDPAERQYYAAIKERLWLLRSTCR